MSKLAAKISYTFPDPMMAVEKRLIAKIDHNLGYIPQVTVKFSFDDIYYSMLPFFSYYQSRQICPGCLEGCETTWNNCYASCDANYNACADTLLANYSACLDARPYEQWYICDAEFDAGLDACLATYGSCLDACDTNRFNCKNNCWSYANTSYTNSQLYFMADEQSIYIYFEINGKASSLCGWPSGSFLNMQGRTFHFKYNISFSELKTSGEENGCNWQEFFGG
jgi:hypothetical protein